MDFGGEAEAGLNRIFRRHGRKREGGGEQRTVVTLHDLDRCGTFPFLIDSRTKHHERAGQPRFLLPFSSSFPVAGDAHVA